MSSTISNSFYIVLTSDASRDQYPENIVADFTMQLTSHLAISELRRKLVTNNDTLCILGPFCGMLRQLSCAYRSHHGEV